MKHRPWITHPRAAATVASAPPTGTGGALPWTAGGGARARDSVAGPHGCVVVRRITDGRGREWRVRELWSDIRHGLLFQCAVPGIRSEIRPLGGSLESLTDDELLVALGPADD
jgi:hypothetical protein